MRVFDVAARMAVAGLTSALRAHEGTGRTFLPCMLADLTSVDHLSYCGQATGSRMHGRCLCVLRPRPLEGLATHKNISNVEFDAFIVQVSRFWKSMADRDFRPNPGALELVKSRGHLGSVHGRL
ncbi:uncharacterized protein LY89DRAFT_10128 [Mollisia scopiformis]|uniref:Uncharacterized protein n=1 Tax=Mollisia scopiformis TaxID=149040 RepID=A0A194XV86_MOLSC|nr:uncharacterized protein LY89DRAFT_10128 [Mollisia scopiformis]KUJ24051.1 hypothetical protein LY89DRAFT_10128 [Mollisia scopiformis]